MTQGSNMTRSHNGKMRKGISLMEMLVAIILLGILSSAGFTYYKNYYSTALASKQIKVAILLDQASQLKNGLELYRVKTGTDANDTDRTDATTYANSGLELLVAQQIITSVPARIDSISGVGGGWTVDTQDVNSTFLVTLGSTVAVDQLLTYDINGTSTVQDKMDYCNILNNIATDGTTNFAVTNATLVSNTVAGTGVQGDINASAEYIGNSFFCYDTSYADPTNSVGLQMVFMSTVQ